MRDDAGSGKIVRNDARTCDQIDTPLTQPRSGPVHGITYFIRAGDAIKIGFASNLKDRLGSLQTSHPDELEVLAAISAVHVDEYAAHQKFAHLRIRGEWFRADKDLLQFIEYAKLKFGEAAPHKPAPRRKPAPKAPKQMTEVQKLRSLASKHGADSPIGHRCSNLAAMIPHYENATDAERRLALAASMSRTMSEIERLTSQ